MHSDPQVWPWLRWDVDGVPHTAARKMSAIKLITFLNPPVSFYITRGTILQTSQLLWHSVTDMKLRTSESSSHKPHNHVTCDPSWPDCLKINLLVTAAETDAGCVWIRCLFTIIKVRNTVTTKAAALRCSTMSFVVHLEEKVMLKRYCDQCRFESVNFSHLCSGICITKHGGDRCFENHE